jgi:hypothetical protein
MPYIPISPLNHKDLGQIVRNAMILSVACICALRREAAAQTSPGQYAVVELGAAGSWSLPLAGSKVGPHAAVEFTPIEDKLSIEAGWTRLSGGGASDQEIDLIFKKPWSLSSKAELMVGAGPEWIHTSDERLSFNAPGIDAMLDFMYWPSKRRRFGWYVETSYDYEFGRNQGRSLGVSGGLLISIRIHR